jgi:hypothetical protein
MFERSPRRPRPPSGGRKGHPHVHPRGTVRVGLSVRASRSLHAAASIHAGRLADGVVSLKAGYYFAGFFPRKGEKNENG